MIFRAYFFMPSSFFIMPSSFFMPSLAMLSFFMPSSFFMESLDMESLDIESFFMSSAAKAGASARLSETAAAEIPSAIRVLMVIGRSSFSNPVLIATHAAGGMDEPEIGFVTGRIEKNCLMMAIWRSAWGRIDRKNEILWPGSINFATVCGAPIASHRLQTFRTQRIRARTAEMLYKPQPNELQISPREGSHVHASPHPCIDTCRAGYTALRDRHGPCRHNPEDFTPIPRRHDRQGRLPRSVVPGVRGRVGQAHRWRNYGRSLSELIPDQ